MYAAGANLRRVKVCRVLRASDRALVKFELVINLKTARIRYYR